MHLNPAKFLLDLLYPSFCAGCHRLGEFLCEDCREHVEFFPLPLNLSFAECFLDKVVSATYFQPPISQLIYTMKYQNAREVCHYLAEFLYETTHFPKATLMTAVPISRTRLNTRGFNQAEEIAKQLAKLTDIPYQSLLVRKTQSLSQASLTQRAERLSNVDDQFSIPNHIQLRNVESIVLIDDVVTTGTTLNECARLLKQAGVKKVFALTVAHGQ